MWKILYGDGTVVSSGDCAVPDVPARDIQVIVQDHPEVGVEMVHGCDYYVWHHWRWWACDLFGLWDYLVEPGWKAVLFGRTLLRHEFDEIFKVAAKEKSGWLPREIRP